MWQAIGAMVSREAYIDVQTWRNPSRKDKPVEGTIRWLSAATLLTESILCYKYRKDTNNITPENATPLYIWLPWVTPFVVLITLWFYLRFKKGSVSVKP